jgi:hypothetical protein
MPMTLFSLPAFVSLASSLLASLQLRTKLRPLLRRAR